MLRNMSSIYSYSKISLSTETILAIIDIGIYRKQFLQFIFINLYFMLHRPTKFRLFQKMLHVTDVLCVLLNCFYLTICTPKENKMDAICFVLFFLDIYISMPFYKIIKIVIHLGFFFNAFYSQFTVLQVQNFNKMLFINMHLHYHSKFYSLQLFCKK